MSSAGNPFFQYSILPLLLLLMSAAATAADAPRTVSGKVFLDANANGELDAGEKGLADVRITDSVQFVTSGPDGSYSITVSDDPLFPYKPSQVVSVSWPSDHWPTGKWWARLDQIEDAKAVHFPLAAQQQPRTFMFEHITDSHSNGKVLKTHGEHFPHMAETVKFVVETGDLGYAGIKTADAMFSGIVNNARTLPVPYFCVPGNHDYVGIHQTDWKQQHPLQGGGAYTKYLGPTRWSFDYGGAHFVGVDWAKPHGDKLEGGVPPTALAFLKRDLEQVPAGTNVFVFVHFPNIAPAALNQKKFKTVCVFGGHSHRHALWGQGNLVYVTQVALWGAGGSALVHVSPEGVEFVYRCAGCKWGNWKEYARKGYHLKLCAMHGFVGKAFLPADKLPPPVKRISGASLPGVKAVELTPADGKVVQIDAEIGRGKASAVGVKLHGERTLAISWDGTFLTCDGIRVSMPLREWETSLRLRIVVRGGIFQMQANGMYQFARPLKAAKLKIDTFADGGAATLKRMDVHTYDPKKPPAKAPPKAKKAG